MLYFTANRNGEAEIVNVILRKQSRLKKLKFDLNFADIAIKGRGSGGNIATKFPINRIELKESGVSTLGARKVWYDETVRRLNGDERGVFLGEFHADDKIMAIHSDGTYRLTGFDFNIHFDDKMISVEKWEAERPVSVVYFDGEKEDWYVKRFLPEASTKPVLFISDNEHSRLAFATSFHHPQARVRYNKRFKHTRDKEDDILDVREFISVKGVKAQGNKLSSLPVTEVFLEPANAELELTANEESMVSKAPTEPVVEEVTEVDNASEVKAVTATDTTTDEPKATPPDVPDPPVSDDGQASLF